MRAFGFRLDRRPVAHLDRITAPFDVDDRRVVEEFGEALGIDGRRRDDDLQVRALGQNALEIAEQEIHVERALVGLVDDDRLVLVQEPVARGLGQQNAVGHQLDLGRVGELVLEARLKTDQTAELGAGLLGDALAHAARCQPAWLGMSDQTAIADTGLQQDLGSCVVLPEPVSPQTITTWCDSIASRISSARAVTGSPSASSIGGRVGGALFGDCSARCDALLDLRARLRRRRLF